MLGVVLAVEDGDELLPENVVPGSHIARDEEVPVHSVAVDPIGWGHFTRSDPLGRPEEQVRGPDPDSHGQFGGRLEGLEQAHLIQFREPELTRIDVGAVAVAGGHVVDHRAAMVGSMVDPADPDPAAGGDPDAIGARTVASAADHAFGTVEPLVNPKVGLLPVRAVPPDDVTTTLRGVSCEFVSGSSSAYACPRG